jgi:hypothetical protein
MKRFHPRHRAAPRRIAFLLISILLQGFGAAGADGPAAPETAGGRIFPALRGDFHLVDRTLSRTVRTELLPDDAARWTYLGSLAVVSAYLESQKGRLRQDVLRSRFASSSGWTDIGGQLGKGRVTQAAAAILYGGGLLSARPRARETGLLLAESYAAAQTTAGLLNFVVAERRPQKGGEVRYFQGGGSAVSLHMTNTMVLSEVLDHEVARIEPGDSAGRRAAKIFGKLVLYGLPTVTAWQRMRSDQHYLWNVVLGAGQSFYVTRGVLRAHDAETGRPPWLPQLALGGPTAGGGGPRVLFRWTF